MALHGRNDVSLERQSWSWHWCRTGHCNRRPHRGADCSVTSRRATVRGLRRGRATSCSGAPTRP